MLLKKWSLRVQIVRFQKTSWKVVRHTKMQVPICDRFQSSLGKYAKTQSKKRVQIPGPFLRPLLTLFSILNSKKSNDRFLSAKKNVKPNKRAVLTKSMQMLLS